jgi:hypothetical protein
MYKKIALMRYFLFMLLIFSLSMVFVYSTTMTCLAKYCPQCGTYNNDSNSFCTKCGADIKNTTSGKSRIGVLFVASVYPYSDARFTIYHKGAITPFIVWNSEGKYEIGEVNLPVMSDIEFIPVLEREMPNPSSVPYISKRYNIQKLMTLNLNSRKIERAPLFSSQKQEIFLDVITYVCPSGEVIQEKRYKGSIDGWPDITPNQTKQAANGVWQQFVPNIYGLLRR